MATERRLTELNSQELANTTWALAVTKRSELQLVGALERAAQEQLERFNVQELSSIAWALATVAKQTTLFTASAASAVQQGSTVSGQSFEIITWVWSFRKRLTDA
eukprot:gnl/TRDRNA2_/TRDRNA2_161064_c4_seq3.p3 gnl/TRDRNA2_/TRDRNA2_161064_c4~~gnl/TRDRNA2_/TRDRNA2_161064_c4_seq3.p3  ORF type:complete len:105 (+),score=23.82 gnl/TRDRNA2_/TRDRNA2_161064_c4_seq3:437-751(+)